MVEAVSRDAEAVSPVQEVKSSALGFANDFNNFQGDLKVRLAKQEERMMVLERKVNMAARPHLSAAAEVHAPHQKAMAAYLRTGDDEGLRGLELEEKALSSVVNSDGGYLVDPVTSDSIASVLSATASIRATTMPGSWRGMRGAKKFSPLFPGRNFALSSLKSRSFSSLSMIPVTNAKRLKTRTLI